MFKQYINSYSNRKYVNCSQNLVKSSIFKIAIWTCFKQQYLHQTAISACFKQQFLHVSNSNTYMFQTAMLTCFKQQYLHVSNSNTYMFQTAISACFKQQYLHVSNSNTYMFQTASVLHVLICLWISTKGTNIIYRCVHNLQT